MKKNQRSTVLRRVHKHTGLLEGSDGDGRLLLLCIDGLREFLYLPQDVQKVELLVQEKRPRNYKESDWLHVEGGELYAWAGGSPRHLVRPVSAYTVEVEGRPRIITGNLGHWLFKNSNTQYVRVYHWE